MIKIVENAKKLKVLELAAAAVTVALVFMYIANNLIVRQELSDDLRTRKDVDKAHFSLSGFFASEGYFPSTSDFNDPQWRAENLPGEDIDAESYFYRPLLNGENCSEPSEECKSFSVAAELSDNSLYSLESHKVGSD